MSAWAGWAGAARLMMLGVSLALVLSGCGGCEGEDRCEGVVCEQGVCSASTGVCINPESCGADSPACLEGYSCGDESRCVADFPCSEGGMCAQGECRTGACVNRDVCQSDDDCVADSFCDVATSACVPNPCTNGEVSCARGVCDRRAGSCVNEVICTTQNEDTACLEGFRCSGRACVSEQAFCDSLACTRGVCSFDDGACVSAARCESDMDCLAGRYCADDNTCQVNACDMQTETCERGVCEASSGECVNPASCNASAQCVDGNLCVGDACVPEPQACGADGCPGNQACNYDALTRTAQCGEAANGACASALDCDGERICRSGRCQAPVACEADALEPNDTAAEATDYFAARTGAGVSASICAGDVDLFAFNTTQSASTIGRLSVTLTISPADRGLGALKLELLNRAGDVSGQATTDARGRAQVSLDVSIVAQGVYTVRVSGAETLNTSGVRYNVFATILDSTVIQACQSPRALVPGMSVNSSTTSGGSTALAMSCADANGAVAEDIYAITVAQRGYVSVTVTPDTDVDLGVSLRSDCLSDGSELRNACANRAGAAGQEVVSALVEPGTYFAVVQADTAAASGFYDISMAIEPAICTALENTCIDANTARECNARGTAFATVSCDNGCSAATGSCNRPVGDVCAQPRVVTLGTTQTIEVDWSALRADYDPGPSGCVPTSASGSATDGPDLSVEVEVPAQTALIATLSDTGRDVSLYVVEDCANLSNTCLVGANASGGTNEALSWVNVSMQPVTVRLIADVEQADSYIPSQLTIEGKSVICAPSTNSCGTSPTGEVISQACDSTGTAYASTRTCLFGCDAMTGLCNAPLNDKCGGALALTSGVTVRADLSEYSVDYTQPSGFCPRHSYGVTGRDAIFKIAATQGDIITVVMAPSPSFDASIWITSSCDAAEQMGSVLACADSGNPETFTLVAPSTGDFYISAAAYSASTTAGTFDLTATVRTPVCTPNTRLGCSADGSSVETCDAQGLPVATPCDDGCLNGACVVPQGDRCHDPIVLTPGTPAQVTLADFAIDYPLTSGQSCFGASVSGRDVIFKITAQQDDIITATLTPGPAFDAVLWVANSCGPTGALSGCVTGDDAFGSSVNPETVKFRATYSGDYYLVGAAYGSGTSSGAFTINATVQQPACTPNAVVGCSLNGQSVEVCDDLGEIETLSCDAAGCLGGACVNRQGRTCFDARQLVGQGGTETGDWSGTNNLQMAPNSYHGQCVIPTSASNVGADTFYQIALQAGELFEASLVTERTSAYLMLFEDCEDTETCVANNPRRGATTLRYYADQPVTLTVVVDSTSTSTTGSYTLNWNVSTGLNCAPGQTRCLDNTTMAVCDADGLTVTQVVCDGVCSGRGCQLDPVTSNSCADVLADPSDIGAGVTLYGNLSQLTNTLNFTAANSCAGGLSTPGPDTFQKVVLNDGEVLEVRAEVFGATRPLIYIINDCSATAASCVAGVAGSTTTYTGQAFYLNDTGAPETLLVGLDTNSSTSTGFFSLSIGKGAPECTPGDRQCDATGQDAQVCNSFGRFEPTACAMGCMNGRCILPPGDVCSDAIALTPGVPVQGDLTAYGVNHARPSSSCPNTGSGLSNGKDVVYSVFAQQGDIIDITLASSFDSVITITDSCDTTTDTAGACLAGRDSGQPERLTYTAPADGEYFIIASAYSSATSTGTFTLTVNVDTPTCTPNTALGCSADGMSLERCDTFGVVRATPCSVNGCMNGACLPPPGDRCGDAIALTPGVPTQGDLSLYAINHTRPSSSCPNTSSGSSSGKDAVYTVFAQAGDIIDVTLASSFDSVITINGSCDTTTNQVGACLAGRDSGQPERLTYVAPNAGDYFIVASAYSAAAAGGPFTITVDVDTPSCAPGTILGCLPDGNTLEVCGALGLPTGTSCANGCVNNRCVLPAGDVCYDPIVLTPGVPVQGNIADYGANHTRASGSCPNTGSGSSSGKDVVYSVFAQQGDIIDVTLNATFNSVITITDSCDTTTDTAGACLAGRDQGNPEVLKFAAPATGDYFIIASALSSFTSTGTFTLTVDVYTPVCMPNTVFGCLPDGMTLERCSSIGEVEQVTCLQGCMNDACVVPAGDSCEDPIALTPGVAYSGTTTGYASNHPFATAALSCTGYSFQGPDTVFSVFALAGQQISVTYTTPSYDGSLWITDTCNSATSAGVCLAGRDASTLATETLTYTAPADGDYLIVTGPYSSTGSGAYTITATVQ